MALSFSSLRRPVNPQVVDPTTGRMREEWQLYFDQLTTRLNGAVGLGDVFGPGSAADGNLASFDGTTGKTLQDSGKAPPAGEIVGTSDTQTLSNKTIAGGSNTITGLPTTAYVDESVTLAKLQHIATSRLLGRATAGSGDPEELTLSQALDLIGSAAQGDLFYRGSSNWQRLAAGTGGQFLQTQGAASDPQWADAGGGWDYATLVNTTSGTAHTLVSGLPSTVREIEIMFREVSMDSNNQTLIVRIGDSGGFETTGYLSFSDATKGGTDTITDGFLVVVGSGPYDAANTITGSVRLTCYDDDNTSWHEYGTVSESGNLYNSCGYKDLSSAITQVQITTSGGTAAFDAGSISLRYR